MMESLLCLFPQALALSFLHGQPQTDRTPSAVGIVTGGCQMTCGVFVALMFLRVSSAGQLLLLLGSLCLLLNILVMTIQWKLGLIKTVIAAVKAPLPTEEVKA